MFSEKMLAGTFASVTYVISRLASTTPDEEATRSESVEDKSEEELSIVNVNMPPDHTLHHTHLHSHSQSERERERERMTTSTPPASIVVIQGDDHRDMEASRVSGRGGGGRSSKDTADPK